MSAQHLDMKFQFVPPLNYYFAFSIDVAATLELYCDGGDDAVLRKLSGLEDRMYAGYCLERDLSSSKDNKYHVLNIRPVQQGLTKPYSRDPNHARPAMCIPISPETAHPRSRMPLMLSKPLPWNNCYHPTCYDIHARIPKELYDYSDTPELRSSSRFIDRPFMEDEEYYKLLRAGLDDDTAFRVIDGEEEGPDVDAAPDSSEINSIICKTFFAKIPGIEEPERDDEFMPVFRIDHVLSNVREICNPLQLWEDRDLFRRIVQEHQLSRYGSVLLEEPEEEEEELIDDGLVHDDIVFEHDIVLGSTGGPSADGFASDSSSDSHDCGPSTSDLEEVPQTAIPSRREKGRVKSFLKRAITKLVELVKWTKFSSKS